MFALSLPKGKGDILASENQKKAAKKFSGKFLACQKADRGGNERGSRGSCRPWGLMT